MADQVFIAALDQGTTSSRCLIFNKDGQPVAQYQEEFTQIHPHPGWHEHDPEEIISSIGNCINKAVSEFTSQGHHVSAIKALGITNQRETTVVWDRKTGKALHNAIVWTDTRTSSIVREFKSKPGCEDLMQICGEELSTYPSVTKLIWLLRNVPEVKAVYDRGDLAFGTIDSWLVYKLNGGADANVHVTDPTNASRTMFLDLHKLKYSSRLRAFFSNEEFNLDNIHFPAIVKSNDSAAFGQVKSGALQGCPITGCLGDQSAALVGQKGFDAGSAKNTYGTGCFLLYNIGEKPVISTHKLMTTVAYDFEGANPVYALEGSIAVAGSGVKFLMNNMNFGNKSESISQLASTVTDSGGLVFVTAFSGLFAPYWIDDAQGTMFGITHHTQRGHIARATLEAVCFQTKAILDAMAADSKRNLTSLLVDGGMSNSDLTMQIQADVTGIEIVRPAMRETTALGAAMAAGLGAGVWKSLDECRSINTKGQTLFKRQLGGEQVKETVQRWEKAVEMTRGWLGVDSITAG